MSKYDWRLDFRGNASAAASHYFPSTNSSYCEASDAVCSECRSRRFQVSTDGSVNASQYCVGLNGCVCVGFCESSRWKPIIVDALCESPSGSSSDTVSSGNSSALVLPVQVIAFIVIAAITVPSLIVVLLSCRGTLL